VLDNKAKLLHDTDVLVFTYDSADPDSFAYIPALRQRYPHLALLPAVYVALKADLDRATQRTELQPDEYTGRVLHMPQGGPVHTSVTWPSIQELFVTIAEAALEPATAFPVSEADDSAERDRWLRIGIGAGAVVAAGAAALMIWQRATAS